MKGLLLKDFYSLRKEYIGLTVMTGLIAIASIFFNRLSDTDDHIFFACIFFAFVSVLTVTAFTYDDKSGFMKYALSTPVCRHTYLAEKYVFQLLNSILFTFTSAAIEFAAFKFSESGITSLRIFRILEVSTSVFLLSNVFGTILIALTIKNNIISAKNIIFSLLCVGSIFCGILIGIIAGLTPMEYSRILFITVFGIIALTLLTTAVWLFIMSFKWAQRKEL